jgi:aryl-alcohol dehydrogenase-like predicted oxidoreductase
MARKAHTKPSRVRASALHPILWVAWATTGWARLGLGGWLTFNALGPEQGRAVMGKAFELGINFLDTADGYGRGKCEEIWGELLLNRKRSDYVLATKVYFPVGDGVNDKGLSRKHVMEACHGSLRRLRTDYIDLYQCHRYDEETPLEETMQALSEVVHAGKARYIGFSEWTPAQIQAALDLPGVEKFVSGQPEYSVLYRAPERERRSPGGESGWTFRRRLARPERCVAD